MRGLMKIFGAIGICLWLGAQAQPAALSMARFEGTGRSCSGTLSINKKTISWITPFSHCNALPYELLEQRRDADKMRYTVRFTGTSPTCRYRILSLTHNEAQDANIGWEVTGYGLEQSYQADKANNYTMSAADMMSCYLVRDKA